MMNSVLFAADHAGVTLKAILMASLLNKGFSSIDKGTHSHDSCDYPDYAALLCQAIPEEAPTGVLICGSGIGMSIAANRFPHIRAALCHTREAAVLARQHNDANVLVLGERVIGASQAQEILDAFLTTAFSGERHQRRVAKLTAPGV